MYEVKENWETIKDVIQRINKWNEIEYKTWIEPLVVVAEDDYSVSIMIPYADNQIFEYFKNVYAGCINEGISLIMRHEYAVRYEVYSDSYSSDLVCSDDVDVINENINCERSVWFHKFGLRNL